MGQTCCGGRANASGAPRPIDKVVADVDSRGLWGGALAHSMKQALATLNRMSRHEGRDLEMFGQATARNILDFKKKNQEIAAKIWEKYDVNGDGELSQEECRHLVVEALKELRTSLPELLESLSQTVLNQLIEDARSHTQDAKLLAEMRRSAEENLKANIKALQEHVDALLADSDKVALEVWKAMDVDQNSKIERSEFLARFPVTTLGRLLDPKELLAELRKDE